MILLKKNSRCLITDELFLEVEWQEPLSPTNDPLLAELIENLDDQLINQSKQTIEDTLPYLSFYQADLLFSTLSQSYGYFTFKRVSLCHQDDKGKGASSEGELFADPYIVPADYSNLLDPLIQAIAKNGQFSDYSYKDKREYFVVTVFPSYKSSLNLSESNMPVFPSEVELSKLSQESIMKNQFSTVKTPVNPRADPSNKNPISKLMYWMLGVLTSLVIVSLFLNFSLMGNIREANKKLNYLHNETQILKDNQNMEHQIDVFSRYFLPNYYSGDKEKLANFLDDGNAKYTIPQEGKLTFVLLESISDKTPSNDYQVTYVLSIADKKGTIKQVRLTYNVKPNKGQRFGFVLTNEPKESLYGKLNN